MSPTLPPVLVHAPCDHHFDYVGLRFEVGARRAGSSAHDVHYFESYRCRRCLEAKNIKLGETHDSYQPIRYGATPKP